MNTQRISKGSLILVSAVCVLLAAGMLTAQLSLRPTKQPGPAAAAPAREPIIYTISGDLPGNYTAQQRVDEAPLVIQGIVGEPLPSRWNTLSGELPADTTVENIPVDTHIYTDYPVQVKQRLRGSNGGDTVLVRVHSGQVGHDKTLNEIDAALEPGSHVVLLLAPDKRTGDLGPEHYSVLWGVMGAYRVVGDQAVNEYHKPSFTELRGMVADRGLGIAEPSGPPPNLPTRTR